MGREPLLAVPLGDEVLRARDAIDPSSMSRWRKRSVSGARSCSGRRSRPLCLQIIKPATQAVNVDTRAGNHSLSDERRLYERMRQWLVEAPGVTLDLVGVPSPRAYRGRVRRATLRSSLSQSHRDIERSPRASRRGALLADALSQSATTRASSTASTPPRWSASPKAGLSATSSLQSRSRTSGRWIVARGREASL